MPANQKTDLYENNKTRIGDHNFIDVTNEASQSRDLFKDKSDYTTFLQFLKEYVVVPPKESTRKKTFVVKGKKFEGVPHLPKNYSGKVEVLAYSLSPNHFHLLLREHVSKSISKLLRSLCTRYAIYYNKKYKVKGSLFSGPYKSSELRNSKELLFTAKSIFQEAEEQRGTSSLASCTDIAKDTWVNSNEILSVFAASKYKNASKTFSNFVAKYEIKFEETVHLLCEHKKMRTKRHFNTHTPNKTVKPISKPKTDNQSRPNLSAFLGVSFGVFLLLFGFGFRNVNVNAKQSETLVKNHIPEVAGISTAADENTPAVNVMDYIDSEKIKEETLAIVKSRINSYLAETNKESLPNEQLETSVTETSKNENRRFIEITNEFPKEAVNIRSKPNINSEVIGQSMSGTKYEYTDLNIEWYEILVDENTLGYVHKRYAKPVVNE